MLRPLAAALIAIAGGLPARAEGPVVVELFTSQGCSACPAADRMLAKLAGHEDVLALALHVDYWDYIGWEDVFADPAYTQRQKAYAHAAGERMIYTPQMVVQGEARVVGTSPAELMEAIGAHVGGGGAVSLEARREGGSIRVSAQAASGGAGEPFDPPLVVQLVRYEPHRTVAITRGENAGHTLDYANVVTSWEAVGRWDGRAPLALDLDAPGDAPAAVLLQESGPGAIHAAARAE